MYTNWVMRISMQEGYNKALIERKEARTGKTCAGQEYPGVPLIIKLLKDF